MRQARAIHRRLLLRQRQLPAEVLDHADDLVPLLAGDAVDLTAHDADALADRVAAAEHVARERLVHDQHAAGFEIERREVATGDHRRAEGGEEAARHLHERAPAQAGRGSAGRRIDLDLILELVLDRKPVGKRDVLDTRLRAEPSFQLIEADARARGKRGRISHVIFAVHVDACGQVSLRTDAFRSLPEPVGLEDAAGGEREECDGDRDLHDDHRGPETTEPEPGARRTLAAKRILHVDLRDPQRRQNADDRGAEQREQRRVQHGSPRQTVVDPERQRSLPASRLNPQRSDDFRDDQPDDRRDAGQHQRLDEQLRDDAAAAGAERVSNRDLPAARGRPGEHERGDVRADDGQQHQENAVHDVQDVPDHERLRRLRRAAWRTS